MAEYTHNSSLADRFVGAAKSFFYNGVKGATGGAIAGAIVFITAVCVLNMATPILVAAAAGAKLGAISTGIICAGAGAFSEFTKPATTVPMLPLNRYFSPKEAEAAIDIPGLSPEQSFADRLLQQREHYQSQNRTIH